MVATGVYVAGNLTTLTLTATGSSSSAYIDGGDVNTGDVANGVYVSDNLHTLTLTATGSDSNAYMMPVITPPPTPRLGSLCRWRARDANTHGERPAAPIAYIDGGVGASDRRLRCRDGERKQLRCRI